MNALSALSRGQVKPSFTCDTYPKSVQGVNVVLNGDCMAELKPCPYCPLPDGLKNVVVVKGNNERFPFAWQCYCKVHRSTRFTSNIKERAIEMWNRRSEIMEPKRAENERIAKEELTDEQESKLLKLLEGLNRWN